MPLLRWQVLQSLSLATGWSCRKFPRLCSAHCYASAFVSWRYASAGACPSRSTAKRDDFRSLPLAGRRLRAGIAGLGTQAEREKPGGAGGRPGLPATRERPAGDPRFRREDSLRREAWAALLQLLDGPGSPARHMAPYDVGRVPQGEP